MAWTEISQGTVVMDGTEKDIGAPGTAGGTFILYLTDSATMAAGDRIELRVYITARTGATERLLYGPSPGNVLVDVQEAPMWASIPVSLVSGGAVRYTAKQTTGTNRTLTYVIISVT